LFQLAGNKRHIQEVGNFGRLPKEKKKKKQQDGMPTGLQHDTCL
jgi:hypothetical protein